MTKRARGGQRRREQPPASGRRAWRRSARGRGGRRAALVAAAGALIVIAAALAWRVMRAPAAGSVIAPVRDNILLVTLDTTRADRLGSYGYARARTRHLDRIASEGVRFDRAISPAPITLPAHASIFTGLYPFEHGVRNNGNFYLPDRFETLTTILSRQGYRTGAFVSAFVLDRRYGLARGFDVYDDRMQGVQAQVVSLGEERRGDHTADALKSWLAQPAPGGAPFFAWLHLYDPHEPYRPPPPFRDAFADSPYDGEVAFDDAVVASVRDTLGQLGLVDHTIIAVVGDHGESLGDHGEETHSMFVYEATLRVPFLLWRPGRLPAGFVVSEPVRLTDLAATLLELVGAPPLRTEHGRSLVPLLSGSRTPGGDVPPQYAETYLPQFYLNWAPLRALRDERWKYIEAPRPELYDLARDPGERLNLYDAQPRTAEAMRGALARLTGGSAGTMAAGSVDREAMQKLAALGYVAAGAGPAPPPASGGQRDPKDVIALFNRLRRANSAVRDRRFADALPILQEVLAEDPRNAFAQLVMGSAYMGMERYEEAIARYRAYLSIVPSSAYAHQWMAICHVRAGRQDEALSEAGAALAIDPKFADAHVLRGGILAGRGRYDEALRELRAAVESDPAKPMVRLDLAKVLDEMGRGPDARREYEAILAIQADYAPALTGLGALEGKSGDLEKATDLLQRSLRIDPSQDGARFNLAQVFERMGRVDDARATYRALAEGPHTVPAVKAAARASLAALR